MTDPGPRLFSASQVTTYELCPRKWGWTYLENLRPAPHPSAQKGIEIHEYLEESLTLGFWNLKDPSYPLIAPAKKALEAIPPSAEIEYYFETEMGGHRFRGYMDLTWLDSHPVVSDHKSTGNLSYAKKPEDLLKDVQATLYTKAAWDKYYSGEPGPVELRWQYYQTKDPPATKQVKLKVFPKDVQARLNKTVISCDHMKEAIDAGKRAGDMTPNWDSCFAFGGCPFRQHCEQEEQAKGTGVEVSAKRDALMARLRGKLSEAGKDAAEGAMKVQEMMPPGPLPPVEPVDINPPADDFDGDGQAPGGSPARVETPVPVQTTVAPPTNSKAPATRRKKTTLYVNCMPISGAKMPPNASTWFEKARMKIDAPHYKLVEYGKGAGLFAVALREVIEAEGGLPEALCLWTGTGEGRDAFEVLASYSDVVVQGVPG